MPTKLRFAFAKLPQRSLDVLILCFHFLAHLAQTSKNVHNHELPRCVGAIVDLFSVSLKEQLESCTSLGSVLRIQFKRKVP